ncbi:uncharacterized protein LOC119416021, partial [Nematolebias whitei]|uniref:uncharacterized protein LOC119416021 n=1 Tax=Nematolebias whitei TaxID=451745 RepID=UPI001899FED7
MNRKYWLPVHYPKVLNSATCCWNTCAAGVIQQGSGEIVPWRQPSEEIDARNYLPCPLCLGFFLRADLWKHQVSCRKKLAIDPSQGPASKAEFPFKSPTLLTDIPSTGHSSMAEALRPSDPETSGSMGKSSNDLAENNPEDPFRQTSNQSSEPGTNQTLTSAPGMDQNQNIDLVLNQPKKRTRVQAAASRLLPISSGASESCSKILHRMNQDNVSYEVKSDWLICKYGNQLIGNQDGGHRKYDYFSQKLRELGRLLLAAKSLNSGIQTLQDLLTPGHLSLVLSAAQKAAGYRWSRPPLSVKSTLKTVCEIAIEESLQDGDWEAAAKTTKFYDILGREWDSLGLQNSDPDLAAPDEGTKPQKKVVQSTSEPREPRSDVVPQNSNTPGIFPISPESRLQTPVPGPAPPRKVPRRPWSSSEKEAIWRQLGDHVLVQSVPGKEVCQRCLDLEPVLRGRHWKDIKNQVHNQIQSQKKQQFHAQMELEENQKHQNQNQKQLLPHESQMDHQSKEPPQNQKKQSYQVQMDLNHQDSSQNPKRPQYQVQVDHQIQDSIQNQNKEHDHQARLLIHKKQLYQTRLDHQDHSQVQKKQLYQ